MTVPGESARRLPRRTAPRAHSSVGSPEEAGPFWAPTHVLADGLAIWKGPHSVCGDFTCSNLKEAFVQSDIQGGQMICYEQQLSGADSDASML